MIDAVVIDHQDPGAFQAGYQWIQVGRMGLRFILRCPGPEQTDREGEDGPMTWPAGHLNVAAHRLAQLAAQGQPQPGTTKIAVHQIFTLVEGLEDLSDHGGIDTSATVRDSAMHVDPTRVGI